MELPPYFFFIVVLDSNMMYCETSCLIEMHLEVYNEVSFCFKVYLDIMTYLMYIRCYKSICGMQKYTEVKLHGRK